MAAGRVGRVEGNLKISYPIEMLSTEERERLERFQSIFGEGQLIFSDGAPAFVAHGAVFSLRAPDSDSPPEE